MKQHNRTLRGAGAVVGLLLSLAAQADNMSFHGRLVEQQPCIINGGENIRVDFGDVIITDVNGFNYSKDIYIPMECEDAIKVRLTHIGAASTFNPAAVKTNIADFGIQLSAWNELPGLVMPLNVGSSFIIHNGSGVPAGLSIQVVPVKKSGVTLGTGDFRGTSTLQFDYP